MLFVCLLQDFPCVAVVGLGKNNVGVCRTENWDTSKENIRQAVSGMPLVCITEGVKCCAIWLKCVMDWFLYSALKLYTTFPINTGIFFKTSANTSSARDQSTNLLISRLSHPSIHPSSSTYPIRGSGGIPTYFQFLMMDLKV